MNYIEEFRNEAHAKALIQAIEKEAQSHRYYRLMEFCGGHTHSIHRYGLVSLLPSHVEMIHGPGCPVCVLPQGRIDQAIELARMPQVLLCSYGDMLRVPGSEQESLLQAKAKGANVKMVYSVDDALSLAILHPDKEVVFFAIGFETSTPPTAVMIQKAAQLKLKNFSVLCNHILTPVALNRLLESQDHQEYEIQLDGFIGPAHVSIIIGSQAYEPICQKYQKPMVISGFEPLDILHSILMLIKQINAKRHDVEIQYTRAVCREGNLRSQALINEVFEIRPQFEWRGLGIIEHSAQQIKPKYSAFDAEKRFVLTERQSIEHKQCLCGPILQGLKKPRDCSLFVTVCSPEHPLGACMVSSEGACAAVYAYGRGD